MKVEATFCPQRTDDLKPGVAELIGQRGVFYVAWVITEDDYVGQWACTSEMFEPYDWVPVCDLADVTVLPSEEERRPLPLEAVHLTPGDDKPYGWYRDGVLALTAQDCLAGEGSAFAYTIRADDVGRAIRGYFPTVLVSESELAAAGGVREPEWFWPDLDPTDDGRENE